MGLGNLFGGGSKKSFDTAALRNILEEGLRKQRGELESGFQKLPFVTRQFEQTTGRLGRELESGARQRAQEFAQGLQQVESPAFVKEQQAKAQELAFRNLPAAQQAIRENLAATGGLQRGAAIRALSAPVLQAQRQAADTGFQIQQAAAGRDIARKEQALDTIFQTGQGAALTRLGIDRDVASTLLRTGREDILNRAMALAGIEQQRTQGLLDIEQLRQSQEIARAQAKRQQLAGLLGVGGGILGAGIGAALPGSSLIAPLIGAQLGTGVGTAVGGGAPTGFDAGAFAQLLAERRKKEGQ